MSPRRLDKTPADYVAIALAPLLIMALIGSLVFFLLDVFYVGRFEARLAWVLSCFIVAVVLVARIVFEEGLGHGGMYGAALGAAAALAMLRLTDRPLVGCLLLVVIWWSAHKLTADCTLIDETVDDPGEGLVETAGLDRDVTRVGRRDSPPADEAWPLEKPAEEDHEPRWLGWLRRIAEPDRRPHAPGVGVLYFSLAALPLFGLGQWFIPAADAERQRYAFLLLCVYLASGLGLLLSTSFLGLRRYLRQRKLEMPLPMTGAWLGVGAAMIAGLLMIGAVIPRSRPAYAELTPPAMLRFGSPERSASRHAPLKPDAAEQGDEDSSSLETPDESSAEGENPPADAASEKPNSSNSNSSNGRPTSGDGGDDEGGQASSRGENTQSEDGADKAAKNSARPQTPGGEPESSRRDEQQPAEQEPGEQQSGEQSSSEGAPPPQSSGGGSSAAADPSSPHAPDLAGRLGELFQFVGAIIRWIFYLFVVVVALVLIVRHGDVIAGWLARAWRELANFWARLWGRPTRDHRQTADENAPGERRRTFADFTNPFPHGGRAAGELVRYSFAALEAWAADRGQARDTDETPLEFADRLGRAFPDLQADAARLVGLYVRGEYAGRTLSDDCLDAVHGFWRRLQAASISQDESRARPAGSAS